MHPAAVPQHVACVFVVIPSEAFTTVVMTLAPTSNGMDGDGEPEATWLPFTRTMALGSETVGVTVTLTTLLATAAE